MSVDLEEVIGGVAMREYRNALPYHQVEVRNLAKVLRDLTDLEFVSVAQGCILESARYVEARGNWEGLHAKASAVYHEAVRRHRGADHGPECRGDTLYSEAHREVARRNGLRVDVPTPCTCGQAAV